MATSHDADADDETLYVVTAHTEDDWHPSSFTVAAADAEAANDKVAAEDHVTDVLRSHTQPFTGTFRVSVGGTPTEIEAAIEQLDGVAADVDAQMEVEGVTPVAWPAGPDMDDESAERLTVSNWGDVELRVFGTDIENGEGNVLSATAESLGAGPESVVEVVAGDRVVARVMSDESEGEPDGMGEVAADAE